MELTRSSRVDPEREGPLFTATLIKLALNMLPSSALVRLQLGGGWVGRWGEASTLSVLAPSSHRRRNDETFALYRLLCSGRLPEIDQRGVRRSRRISQSINHGPRGIPFKVHYAIWQQEETSVLRRAGANDDSHGLPVIPVNRVKVVATQVRDAKRQQSKLTHTFYLQ